MKIVPRTSSLLASTLPQDMHTPFKLTVAVTIIAVLFSTISSNSHAGSPNATASPAFAPNRILIETRPGLSDDDLAKIVSVHGGKARKIGQSNLHVVELSGNASEKGVAEKLTHNPHLKFAELDLRHKTTFVANDPYLGSEWHLLKIGASTAWDTTQGGGVTIAILDSGVDPSHPDLVPNLVPGFNMVDNNTNTADVCGHGTAVAGTAAASTNNGTGVAGVAGQAKIMPIRIAFRDATDGLCYAYSSTIASGLTYAADHGVRVANISYGNMAATASIQSAAQYLKNKGGLTIVSAGNNGIDENITPTSTMIAVSATDSNDNLTSWSSYGSFVALSAPGAGIWTTSNGGIYQAWNGTSFSSPLTAGVAALMMAANASLDGAQIEKLMFSTAVDLGTAGRDPYYGYGRVNAAAGVQAAATTVVTVDTQAPSASISAPAANSTVSGLVTVNVAATDNVGVARVELQVRGTTVAVDTAAPFGFTWDSNGVPNGMTTLVAVAYDAAGNAAGSAPVSVNVANVVAPIVGDTSPPVVRIANPVSGTVSGTVTVSVSASDNAGAAGISLTLYIDGIQKAHGAGAALSYSWNTRKATSGSHVIQAVARDAAGNTSSTSVGVNSASATASSKR